MSRKFVRKLGARVVECAAALLLALNLGAQFQKHAGARAQSIGYHPQFNLGFNPYNSPVFGYGLGLPFGAYNMSPTRNPWLLGRMPQVNFFDKTGLMSKLHAKAFLKKLATSQILSPGYAYAAGIKDKLNLMKHPEFAYSPYGAGYGYGKHYGAALVPNNPYKSAYSDYYDQPHSASGSALGAKLPKHEPSIPIGGRPLEVAESQAAITSVKPYGHYLKPLIKAGALLTTAVVLGKKVFEVPMRLNPTGMILNDIKP